MWAKGSFRRIRSRTIRDRDEPGFFGIEGWARIAVLVVGTPPTMIRAV